MATTQITTHEIDAKTRLTYRLQNKTRLTAFLSVLTTPLQELENALWQLFTLRFATNATGNALDIIGKIVRQPRTSITDSVYRQYIFARIATNRSRGTVNELINIARLVLNNSTATVGAQRQDIATIVIRTTTSAATAAIILEFLLQAASAGVRLLLENNITSGGEFIWDVSGRGWDNGALIDATPNGSI